MTTLNSKRVAESFTKVSEWEDPIRKAVKKIMVDSENFLISKVFSGGELLY